MLRTPGSIRITPRVLGLSVYGSYSCMPDLAHRHRARVSGVPLPNRSARHLITDGFQWRSGGSCVIRTISEDLDTAGRKPVISSADDLSGLIPPVGLRFVEECHAVYAKLDAS